jgi:hypothetical protein
MGWHAYRLARRVGTWKRLVASCARHSSLEAASEYAKGGTSYQESVSRSAGVEYEGRSNKKTEGSGVGLCNSLTNRRVSFFFSLPWVFVPFSVSSRPDRFQIPFFSFVRLSRPPPRRKRVNSILIILVVVVGATPHAPHHKVTNPQNSWSQPSEHPNPESVTTPSNLLYARVVHFPTSHDRIRSRRVCLCTHSFQSQL